MRTPHNFLIYLRNLHPELARLFDGVKRLGLTGHALTASADLSLWPGNELNARRAEINGAATSFFGEGWSFELEEGERGDDFLPIQIAATKYWNHVAFLSLGEGRRPGLFVLRKTDYLGKFLEGGFAALGPDTYLLRRLAPPGQVYGPEELILDFPALLDEMCDLARTSQSYVQFLAEFPGHADAEKLESRLYAVKEWGTPQTPAPILQKYVGRIHFADPVSTLPGLKLILE